MKCVGILDKSVSLLIGGEAGQGITRSGSLLGKAFMRGGFHIFGVNDYPSLIRGGHNFYVLRASDERVHSQADSVDMLLALNKETILIVAGEASGDLHGARLVRELRALDQNLVFYGVGGDNMQAAGVQLSAHISDIAVVGLTEVLSKLKHIAAVYRLLK